jgi:hypothetical protein
MEIDPSKEFNWGHSKNGHELLEGIPWHNLDSADQECF